MGSQKRVLVVDDDPDMLAIYQKAFSQANFHVESANNGSEAGFRLNRAQFDLIVTDLHMPYADGISLIKELREGVLNNKTPVIVCSGQLDRGSLASLLKRGVRRIVAKPVNTDELIKTAKELMTSSEES